MYYIRDMFSLFLAVNLKKIKRREEAIIALQASLIRINIILFDFKADDNRSKKV